MMQKLTSGDAFPALSLQLAGGDGLQLPDDLKTPFTILLFYRGHW